MTFDNITNFDYSDLFFIKFNGEKVKQNNQNLKEKSIKGIIQPSRHVIDKNHTLKRLNPPFHLIETNCEIVIVYIKYLPE